MPRNRLGTLLSALALIGTFSSQLIAAGSNTWTTTGNLSEARSGAAAVLLSDGRILLTGGRIPLTGGTGASGPAATTEFFNTNGTFSAGPDMQDARANHTAVVLQDGRVLVVGGATSNGGVTNSAEVYDPVANSWKLLENSMNVPRSGHTASLLLDGTVLIAGGQSTSGPTNTLEIFSPATNSFMPVSGTLSSSRVQHAAAVFQDGRVLIAGGSDGTVSLKSADIYDPVSGAVSSAGTMSSPRAGLSATTLLDGTVLLAGGNNGSADLASAEIYNPTAVAFSATGSLAAARSGHLAFLLPNNNGVLVAGGGSAGVPLASAELFYPWTGTFNAVGAMATARIAAAGSALKQDGQLLIAGGSDGTNPLSAAEIFSFATVKTDKADYPPGTTVNIIGSGWQPGEIVSLTLIESPLIDTHGPFSAVADSSGNISNSSFVTDEHDLAVHFSLMAKGSASQAQNTFTDGNATSVGGTVRDNSGNAILGATIVCTSGCTNSPQASTSSGSDGSYIFNSSTTKLTFSTNGPVAIQLTASKSGYTSETIPLSVSNSNTLSAEDFALTPSSVSTKTAVSASPSSPTYGASVTFTATVAPTSGGAVPTGTVQFAIDSVTFGLPVTLTACSPAPNTCAISIATTTLTAGSHTVTATYTPTGTFTESNGSIAVTITRATPTVSFTGAPASAAYGAQFTVAATTNSTAIATITASGACTISGTSVTMISGSGSCNLQANWLADINYVSASATQTTTATPALASVSVPNTTVTYDGNPHAVTPAVSPAVTFAETYTGISPTVYATSTTAPSQPGSYTVAATVTDPNYTGSGTGTLTIQQKDPGLTLLLHTGTPEPSTYGYRVYFDLTTAGSPCPTGQVQFFVDGQASSTVTLSNSPCTQQPIQFSTAALTPGPHSVYATYSGDSYYLSGQSTTVSHTVSPEGTNVTLATSATTLYVGDSLTLTATVTPATDIDGTATAPTGTVQFYDGTSLLGASPLSGNTAVLKTTSVATGPHNITATYVSDDGLFTGSSSPVSVETVEQITPTITWPNPADIVYGTALSSTQLNATATDQHNGGETVSGTFTYTPVAGKILPAGQVNLTVTFKPDDTSTYASTGATATINVIPAALTITADNVSRAYGAANPQFTFQYSGFVNSEVSSVVTTPPTCTTTADKSSAVGPYAITCSGAAAANYTIKYFPGTLNVTAAPLTITANDLNKTYGQTKTFAGTEFTASGLVNGDTVTTVTLTSSGTAATAAARSYSIVPGAAVGTGLGNYTISYVNGTLTVNQAALTITAKNATKAYGQTLTFAGTEFTTSGLVNGDSVTSVALASAGAAATATVTTPGPNYPTMPSAAQGTGLDNYKINYVNGTLCIKPAPLTITAKDASKTYGQTPAFQGTEFTTSTLVNGDMVTGVTLTSTGAAATATVVGSPYAITPSAAVGTGLGNYTISYVNGMLTVTPAMLTLKLTGSAGTYNAMPFPAACSVANGLVNGDSVTLSIAYSSIAPPVNVGNYTATCTSSGNANYQTASGQTTIVIIPATLTITADDRSMTFGDTSPSFTATYKGLQGTDSSAVVSGLTFTVYIDQTKTTPVTNFQAAKAGSYPIVPSDGVAANYAIQYGDGMLTVNKATLAGSVTITPVDPNTVAYGQPVTATVNLNSYSIGGVPVLRPHADSTDPNVQLPESLTVYLVPAGGGPSQAMKFGTATALPTYDNTNNTTGTTKTGWTASVKGNAPIPGNYNAVVYGDDPGDNTLTSLNFADAGYFYPDTADISYTTLQSPQLDVIPAALTITAKNANKTYGQPLAFAGTEFTISGLVNGDSVTSVTLASAGAAATATVTTPGPNYPINASKAQGAGLSNYTISYVNGALTVTPAVLTITANSYSRYYGNANPPLDVTYAGLVNNEGPSVLGSNLSCSTAAIAGSDPAIYPINCGGLADPNYTIKWLPGSLTVVAAPTSVSISSVVGTSSLTVNLTATVVSSFTPVVPIGSVSFLDTSTNANLGTAPLSNGQAILRGVSLGVGTHLIQAVYAPNADFVTNSSAVANQNLGATITTPSSNADVFAVNTSVPLSANFTAASTANPTAVWTITDPATSSTFSTSGTVSKPNITGSYTFSSADVYGFTLTFSDGLGGVVITNTVSGSPAAIVIYDPSAGFVTGGGWINSPAGAYIANASLTGKATFGFVSKYQKGATVPTGDTEFQFQVGNLDFHSNTYQWLVISGGLAQYKGTGTINGTGTFNFLLSARDGALYSAGTPDGFRIKITDQSGSLIYDNMYAAGNDNLTSGNTEALGGGSVIIHSK